MMRVLASLLCVSLVVLSGCSSDKKEVEEAVSEVSPTPAPMMQESDPMAEEEPMTEPVQEEVADVTQEAMLYVTTSLLNVRSGPGMSNEVVRVASFKEKVPSMEKAGNWVKIGEGQYVYSAYVSESEPMQPNDPEMSTEAGSSAETEMSRPESETTQADEAQPPEDETTDATDSEEE